MHRLDPDTYDDEEDECDCEDGWIGCSGCGGFGELQFDRICGWCKGEGIEPCPDCQEGQSADDRM